MKRLTNNGNPMSILLSVLLSSVFSAPAAATTCQNVTTCEVVGTHEECRYNRRGQYICTIVADQECSTELVCYEDGNLGGGDCFYLVGDALYECLQG